MEIQNIFIEIKSDEEKALTFASLASARAEVLVKSLSPDSHLFRAKIYEFAQNQLSGLVALSADQVLDRLPQNEEVVVQMQAGDEKLVMQTKLKRELDIVRMQTKTALFKIQRRSDFRIRIPADFETKIKFEGKTFEVQDLSAGGCKLQVLHGEKIPRIFSGELQIRNRESLPMDFEVRHRRADPSAKKFDLLGLQFRDLPDKTKNVLASVVMDIYREYIRKNK